MIARDRIGLLVGALLVAGASVRAGAAEVRGRVLDAAGQPVGQAVVFVRDLPPEVLPKAAAPPAVMDQVNTEFVPHVLPVVVGTEVRFPNHDQIHHHVYSFSRTKTFEIPLYKGDTAPPVRFDQTGVVKIGCNIHDWMSAVIVVVPSGYYAVTGADGAFSLGDLPAGTYGVASWHEQSTAKLEDVMQRVTVDGDPVALTFTLPLATARARRPMHGARVYR
jgi:plastocyanin